ncbi:MAG: M56 family metallopeptidase [Chitinophagales bacterium]
MLQYLLNTTAIWLISLVMFDIFLRRESYHGYNRFYLLFTFLLGAFLPLWQWQDNGRIYETAIGKPLHQVITAKQSIVTATTPAAAVNWQQWLTILYLAGVLVALCLLIIEIIKLVTVYRSGKKSQQVGWTIIETGKEHAPFSFLNTLFVCSRQQYNDDEWSMIIAHEKRHTILFHIADLLLMQTARIVFWFHPLVYLYNKHLLLVHEYQADNASSQQPQVYGRFLVEQAVLQSAPALSHSFNRSPIKKRILMLTRRSSTAAKSKILVFIPLLLVCIICFSQNTYSNRPKKEGNICIYKGNTIEFLAPKKPGSYLYTDEVTGQSYRKPISWPMPPIKVNGAKVYDPSKDKNVTPPVFKSTYKSHIDFIIRNAEKEICELDNGEYSLLVEDVVIDEKGKVVYFDNNGVFQNGKDIDAQKAQKQKIDNKIDDLMNKAPLYEPASANDKPVPFLINSLSCFTYGYTYGWEFTIKDHKIVWDITTGTTPPAHDK